MSFAVQSNFNQSYQYGSYGTKASRGDDAFGKEFMGSATSHTTSSDKGENIGVMTIGNRGYIAKYADSSTEQNPVIKVGDYEVRVNDVDPKNATEIEMFALTSYMDDKGLTDNTGMKAFNKMRAYSKQAEYSGFCNNISDQGAVWTQKRDWTTILENAKESYYRMPQSYHHGLNCERIISALLGWSQGLQKKQNYDGYSEKEWDKMLSSVDKQIRATERSDVEGIDKSKRTDDKYADEKKADLLTARSTTYEQGSDMTDPETGQAVSVRYVYRNFYTKEGIISGRSSYDSREAGIKDAYSWKVDFNSEDDYERAMRFLDRIPDGDTTKFLTREDFWQDFVNGDIDEEEFFEYYETLDHGKANFIKQDENGNNYIDKEMMSSKYYKYFGIQQVKTVPWEDLQRGLEQSAFKERGFDHSNGYKKDDISLYDSLREAFTGRDAEGFRFYGEDDTYSIDEWIQEIIRRTHMGLMGSLFPIR